MFCSTGRLFTTNVTNTQTHKYFLGRDPGIVVRPGTAVMHLGNVNANEYHRLFIFEIHCLSELRPEEV